MKKYTETYKSMSVEDKVLLFMEVICYLLSIGTLIATIYIANRGYVMASGILVISMVGLIGCGLNAKSSRDSYIGEFKYPKASNKSVNELLLSKVKQ